MGHYLSEMNPNGITDIEIQIQLANYHKACRKEISHIIETNPISFKEINVGDKLTLYSPLKGLSKIRFDKREERHKIREFFKLEMVGIVGGALYQCDKFEVYDKREMKLNDNINERKKTRWYEVRIDEPRSFDWLPHWIYIKYFEKI